MRIAAVQFDIVWEDKSANHAIVERMLAEADPEQVPPGSFVLLPELADTGFSMNLGRIVDDRSLAWARGLARRLRIYLQHGYAERAPDGRGRNCASIISPDGTLLGTYRKVHPFSYGKEAEYYSGGNAIVLRRCGEAMLCPLICYDLRFPELWRVATVASGTPGVPGAPGTPGVSGARGTSGTTAGAEVFTLGASWPAARQTHWRALLLARAIENQAWVVAVNRVGADPHLSYAGGSMIVSPKGDVVAEAGSEPRVISADLDIGMLRRWRGEFPALRDIRSDLLGSLPLDTTI
jgi:predicted amidohydrolase